MDRLGIKAIAVDDENVHHLIIGLNRENVDSILKGDVLTLPAGYLHGLTENSDVVVLFPEADGELGQRFPPSLRPS